jgi:hypothetical protein
VQFRHFECARQGKENKQTNKTEEVGHKNQSQAQNTLLNAKELKLQRQQRKKEKTDKERKRERGRKEGEKEKRREGEGEKNLRSLRQEENRRVKARRL